LEKTKREALTQQYPIKGVGKLNQHKKLNQSAVMVLTEALLIGAMIWGRRCGFDEEHMGTKKHYTDSIL
jgi:hypothetical protein